MSVAAAAEADNPAPCPCAGDTDASGLLLGDAGGGACATCGFGAASCTGGGFGADAPGIAAVATGGATASGRIGAGAWSACGPAASRPEMATVCFVSAAICKNPMPARPPTTRVTNPANAKRDRRPAGRLPTATGSRSAGKIVGEIEGFGSSYRVADKTLGSPAVG